MTTDEERLRRLLAAALALALAGAGVALGIFLTRGSGSSQPSIFPASFSEPGFLAGSVRLEHSYDAPADEVHVTGELSAGRTSYIVARCNRGGIVVTVGSATTSQPCTGRPEGVITLQAPRTAPLKATVTERQTNRWGLAIYH